MCHQPLTYLFLFGIWYLEYDIYDIKFLSYLEYDIFWKWKLKLSWVRAFLQCPFNWLAFVMAPICGLSHLNKKWAKVIKSSFSKPTWSSKLEIGRQVPPDCLCSFLNGNVFSWANSQYRRRYRCTSAIHFLRVLGNVSFAFHPLLLSFYPGNEHDLSGSFLIPIYLYEPYTIIHLHDKEVHWQPQFAGWWPSLPSSPSAPHLFFHVPKNFPYNKSLFGSFQSNL